MLWWKESDVGWFGRRRVMLKFWGVAAKMLLTKVNAWIMERICA